MKTLLTLLLLSALGSPLAAQTPPAKLTEKEKIAAARAAENKSMVLAQLKAEVAKKAVRYYLKVTRSTPQGLLCERRAVVPVATNKRRSDGSYYTTDTMGGQSMPPLLLIGEKPRPAGGAFVIVTVYPAARPAGVEPEMECAALTPEMAVAGTGK